VAGDALAFCDGFCGGGGLCDFSTVEVAGRALAVGDRGGLRVSDTFLAADFRCAPSETV
jgi:hypothetical protein